MPLSMLRVELPLVRRCAGWTVVRRRPLSLAPIPTPQTLMPTARWSIPPPASSEKAYRAAFPASLLPSMDMMNGERYAAAHATVSTGSRTPRSVASEHLPDARMHGHLPPPDAGRGGEGLVLFQRADVLEETDGVRDGLRDRRFHSLEQERGGGPRAGSHRRRAAAAFAPEAGRLGEHSHLQAQFLEEDRCISRQLGKKRMRHARGTWMSRSRHSPGRTRPARGRR